MATSQVALAQSWSIPLVESRRQADPLDSKLEIFCGFVPFELAPKFVPTVMPWINPRVFDTDITSKIRKIIKTSALNDPSKFHRRNRGLTLIGKSGKLTDHNFHLKWGNGKAGLLDGGTTLASLIAIYDELKAGNLLDKGMFRLEVLCGDYSEDDIVDIAESRNKSVQVSSFALANLRNEFDWIKSALGKVTFPTVAYATNEDGEIDIEDIVQILGLFMMPKPQQAYTSKEKTLENFMAESTQYRKMRVILPDVMMLSEYVVAKAKPLYNGNGGAFGKLGIIWNSQPKDKAGNKLDSETKLPILGSSVDYNIHTAWQYPLVSAFEPLIDRTTSPFTWKTDPFKLYDKIAPELIEQLNDYFNNEEGNLTQLGKSWGPYAILRGTVKGHVKA